MPLVRHLCTLSFVVVAGTACGKSADKPAAQASGAPDKVVAAPPERKPDVPTVRPTDPRVTVGAFTVPVPTGWADVSKDRAQPGQVGLRTTDRTPPVMLILSPAPSPMPFDPTDAVACAANGGRMPGVVGTPGIVELPAGKACVVHAGSDKHLTMTVLAVGDKGVMAQCQYEDDTGGALCEPIVGALTLAK